MLALEQRDSEFLFQCLDLRAGGGLRYVQAPACLREASELGNRGERLELIQVHLPFLGWPLLEKTNGPSLYDFSEFRATRLSSEGCHGENYAGIDQQRGVRAAPDG